MATVNFGRAFNVRRFWNWFPLGMAYASLYMGRYSYIPAKEDFKGGLMGNEGLGLMTMVGAFVYGVSFLFNGPLTDKFGGRKAMMISTMGSGIINILMGTVLYLGWTDNFVMKMAILFGFNMYFQSFASVAIVKVNSNWFHISERGVFGGIFGILISSGLFLAYTVSPWIMGMFFKGMPQFYFYIPGILLLAMFLVTVFVIKDTPEDCGFTEFTTGTDTEFDTGEKLPVTQIVKQILTHPIVLTIAFIELCTGVLRDGMFGWFGAFSAQSANPGVRNWLGVGLFLAGASGSMVAGWLSDKLFNSRRPPVAMFLYGAMIVILFAAWGVMSFLPSDSSIKPVIMFGVVFLMAFGVIGTHGVLSGAATADFGGKQATATATGIIDGFVYLGVAIQGFSLGKLTAISWNYWIPFLIPFAMVGFFLSYRVRNVKPKLKGGH
ncbi:MAG: MFS transporter [Deltaproteobacteria bacterium]|nr:MFS transporter [Deltaproteobacteria bacterium]